jgi:hypothetical protein
MSLERAVAGMGEDIEFRLLEVVRRTTDSPIMMKGAGFVCGDIHHLIFERPSLAGTGPDGPRCEVR